MCGIAGACLAKHQTLTLQQCQNMLSAIAHRGPDGQGQLIDQQQILLHSRLSIIDLKTGQQPLYGDGLAVIANGEIYNDPVLRKEFAHYPFQTHSDCEAILPLWNKEKENYPNSLRGMYAIALFDRLHKKQFLSRDPFGIKPLYYAELEQGLIYASEISALFATSLINPVIHQPALDQLLQLQFISGQKTIFQGISRLLPGETIEVIDGKIVNRQQINPYQEESIKELSEQEAIAKLDQTLEDSVSVHERSDVPFGLFLSSGIDSTVILRMMQRLGQEKRIKAWTASFTVDGKQDIVADETEQAKAMAEAVGAEHHILSINEKIVWQNLPKIIACMDDPVADYAIIPTWLLAQEASKSVKVILSGEGGDELFGGYGRYRKAQKPWWLGGRKLYKRGNFDGIDILRPSSNSWRQEIAQLEKNINAGFSAFKQAQAIDIASWLPNDLMIKLDRCLMAHGVEGRVPFLDKSVAQIAGQLPDNLKIRDRKGKWLLRQWLQKEMPQANPFMAKKGFTVPIGHWIEQRAEQLAPLIAKQEGIKEIAFPEKILPLFQNASGRRERHAAWTLLFYALWHQIHVVGKATDGDVFEVLAD